MRWGPFHQRKEFKNSNTSGSLGGGSTPNTGKLRPRAVLVRTTLGPHFSCHVLDTHTLTEIGTARKAGPLLSHKKRAENKIDSAIPTKGPSHEVRSELQGVPHMARGEWTGKCLLETGLRDLEH